MYNISLCFDVVIGVRWLKGKIIRLRFSYRPLK